MLHQTITKLSIFRSIICQVVAHGRLKTKDNFNLLALKVVAVAYEKWSLTRGSKYSDLTKKLLACWTTSCLGGVVTCERRSQPEVRLYCSLIVT